MNADLQSGDQNKNLGTGKVALIALGAVLLAWLIIRSFAIASGGVLAERLAADSGAAMIAGSGVQRLPGDQVPAPAQLARLHRAARKAPLRYEPFFAQAMVDRASGRWGDAVRAGEAARDREPRVVAVRGLLLEAYLHQRRYPAAIAQLGAIVDRSDDANPDLLKLLTLLADDPGTARYVSAALRTNPRWRSLFVDYAGAHARNKALLFKTLLAGSPALPITEQQANQTSFVNSLVAAGDYQRAYLAWVNFLPPQDVLRVDAIYDGDFRGAGGGAPFNWTLASNENAAVERSHDTVLPGGTALDVQFYGGATTILATQTLLVPSGDYRFTAVTTGSNGSQFGGALSWSITCLPSGTLVPLARMTRFPATPFRITGRATIPASGCTAQQLTLTGEPGEVSSLIAAQFTHVALIGQ